MDLSNPEQYLAELTRPLLTRFSSEPSSRDLAVATCIVLFHFADSFATHKNIKVKDAAREISQLVPFFTVVSSLANASKHIVLTRPVDQNHAGLTLTDIKEDRAAAFTDGTYFDDGTTWTDLPKTVSAVFPDGRKYDVLYTCNAVLDELERQLEVLMSLESSCIHYQEQG